MNETSILSVRELQAEDIELVANYWVNSDPDFLAGMGVDLNKMFTKEEFTQMLKGQLALPIEKRKSYALIWTVDGIPVGHCNVSNIDFGKKAFMHLHLWKSDKRQRGFGTELVKKSLPFYFEKLQLKTLYCEPYALNPAPNKTLEKVGFEFVKKRTTTPGSHTFEQEVNRWKMEVDTYLKI
ncbi:GNAT family protein [Limibacter armeniacum]|uniref:GNAT family N-acetyltransferase n=1 Tax=Limibacter armeniacum TaxID=466084 RepID=UPI002FE583E8